VEVVRHQAHCNQWQLQAFLCLHHQLDEGQVVDWLVEDIRAKVGAVQHVVTVTGIHVSQWAWHVETIERKVPASTVHKACE
jgi:hypothetical protein